MGVKAKPSRRRNATIHEIGESDDADRTELRRLDVPRARLVLALAYRQMFPAALRGSVA